MSKKQKIADVAKRWVELAAQAKEIEKEKAEIKPVLEGFLAEAEGKTMEVNGWRFSLVEFLKETFSLSKAKEKVDGRVLAPYITETPVVQIRTSWQGGDGKEKEAA